MIKCSCETNPYIWSGTKVKCGFAVAGDVIGIWKPQNEDVAIECTINSPVYCQDCGCLLGIDENQEPIVGISYQELTQKYIKINAKHEKLLNKNKNKN